MAELSVIIIYVLGALLALAGLWTFMNFRPSQKVIFNLRRNAFVFITLLIGAFLILSQAGLLAGIGVSPLAGGTVDQAPQDTTEDKEDDQTETDTSSVCAPGNQVEDTTLTINGIDKFDNTQVGESHEYTINDGASQSISNGNSDTVSPGDEVEVLWTGENTSSSYLGAITEHTVPCSGTFAINKKLYPNGSVDVKAFDSENNLLTDGSTANQSIKKGQTYELDLDLQSTFQSGHPHGGAIIAEYNSSMYDEVVADFGLSDVSNSEFGPDGSIDFYTESSTDNNVKAYHVPRVVSDESDPEGTLRLEVTSSTGPTINQNTSNVNLTYAPKKPYINSDEGGEYQGPAVEDEDDSQTYDYTDLFTVNVDKQ